MPRAATLPNDIETLKRLVLERTAALEVAQALLLSRQHEIEQLKLQIARLRRMHFGRSAEALDEQIRQLEFKLEELESEQATVPVPPPTATERRKSVRRPLPERLSRERVVHEPTATCACPQCGGVLGALGEDVAEMLEYVPQHWKVIRHVRPKYRCARCERIVQAPAPSRPIARGVAGPGLLAHVLVSKYCDHLPLYRQSDIYAREGVELERSTLADWVGGTSALLAPLVEALRRHVMSATKLHADDTPVPVLAPGNGKTKTGRLWTYVRDDRPAGNATPAAVWFAYTPDRKGEHPQAHLSKFTGTLQADGYAGFDQVYETGRIQEAPAGRRKFYDLVAQEALRRIGELYDIEAEIRGHLPDERHEVRNERARPLLESLQQ